MTSLPKKAAPVAAPICPIPERLDAMTFDILHPWPALQGKAETFFRHYGYVFDELAECAAVQRLRGIYQFGVKWDGMQGRFRHDRWLHSRHVAAHMIAIGTKLEMSGREMLVGALGACLHDVGYGPFSHDSDYFLEPNGYDAHEERGKALITTDLEIGAVLHNARVAAIDITNVIAETGMLGQLQRFCDSGAYVVLDSLVYGKKVPMGVSGTYVDSIQSVNGYEIAVTNRKPLAWAIRQRGELGRRYFSPINELSTAGLVIALQHLYDTGRITLHEVAAHDDASLTATLLEAAANRRQPQPEWWRSIARLVCGNARELPRWAAHSFATEIAREAFIGGLVPSSAANVVRVNPRDYTSKVITVRVNGKQSRLKAHESLLLPYNTAYHAYVFTG